MGSELVSEVTPANSVGAGVGTSASISYTDTFREHLPYYISVGMTPTQFYDEDVYLTEAYRKADELTKARTNQTLWLQGLYVYEAIMCNVPVLHAFSGKGAKPIPYRAEPYPLTEQEEEEHEKRKFEKMLAKMHAAMTAFNSQKGSDADGR